MVDATTRASTAARLGEQQRGAYTNWLNLRRRSGKRLEKKKKVMFIFKGLCEIQRSLILTMSKFLSPLPHHASTCHTPSVTQVGIRLSTRLSTISASQRREDEKKKNEEKQ